MHKTKPKLRYDLARKSVCRYFEHKDMRSEKEEIWKYCREHMSHKNMLRLSLRVLKCRCENALIASLIASQSEEKRRFIVDEFRNGLPDVTISMNLHVHPQCLAKWKSRFLEDVICLMFYRLPKGLLFHSDSVKVMLHVIEVNLRFYRLYCSELAEPAAIQILRDRKEIYWKLYRYLKQVEEADTLDGATEQIIKTKLCHRFDSIKELARRSGYAEGTVSEKLNAFLRQYDVD